ncbi:hypothetical protein L596_016765 [Steinernema carpocapsae]|uniref:Uncharacterized protein n=1 Tax=Steinernema carpocapsae TaxID=34508 RepID=A0A4U5NKA8_STECR|nr:hypothetical protein L596_016765 [Steinernema carpocapsae]
MASEILRLYKELLENENDLDSYEFHHDPEIDSFLEERIVERTPSLKALIELYENSRNVFVFQVDVELEYRRMMQSMTFKIGKVDYSKKLYRLRFDDLFQDYAKELKLRIVDSKGV